MVDCNTIAEKLQLQNVANCCKSKQQTRQMLIQFNKCINFFFMLIGINHYYLLKQIQML